MSVKTWNYNTNSSMVKMKLGITHECLRFHFWGIFAIHLQCLSCFDQSKIQKQPPELFSKKGVLRNFAKFIGKHLWQSLFFNKVAGLKSATLLKKKSFWHRCFPVNFAKFLRTAVLQDTSGGCFWKLLL